MAKAERLVLVDGSWLVFRAFFAIPANLTTRDGLPTNAIFGFATMFRKLFAGPHARPRRGGASTPPSPRTASSAFPSTRRSARPCPASSRRQLPDIDRLVLANRFPLLRRPGWEADDIIATLARRGVEAGMEVVIVAGDKDLAQLVGDKVRMQDTMRDVTYDAELVRKKWGVPPALIPDLLALMGDDVDNIPGVPGIGQKGAATLLEKYGSLDGVLAHTGELKGKQKAALEENRETAKLYRELATVDSRRRASTSRSTRSASRRPTRRSSTRSTASSSSTRCSPAAAAEAKAGDAPDVAVDVPADVDAARAAIAALPAGQPVALVPLFEPAGAHPPREPRRARVAAEGRAPFYLAFRGRGAPLGDAAVELLRGLLADEGRPKVVHDVKELAILAHAARAHARRARCSTR